MRAPASMSPARHGLTLIEIIGIILLLGLFAGMGSYIFQATQNAAFRRQTQATLQSNAAFLQTFMAQTGRYPDELPPEMPTQDAWGRPLVYQRTPSGFSLRSLAKDGLLNTADDLTYEQE